MAREVLGCELAEFLFCSHDGVKSSAAFSTALAGGRAMTADTDVIVIGAGVVGLAAARELARSGREVIILEKEGAIGTGISSRNSEVIHAGIYYPPGSLRARLCVRGRALLYDFARDHGVGHRRIGKLLVATSPGQERSLAALRRTAEANGVSDLEELSPAKARSLEPDVACSAALLSPSTGIIDAHGLMLALQGDAEAHGAAIALRTQARSIALRPDGTFSVATAGEESTTITCRRLVLAAGLHGTALAQTLAFAGAYQPPGTHLARGRYYMLSGRSPFARLVYPMPEGAWLGTHLTLDLAGRARFGPDLEWIETIDYRFDRAAEARFYAEIRRYWPGLPDGALEPGYTGIRPKIYREGQPPADFAVHGAGQHGIERLVLLFGIESPGLTSSLAIAEEIARQLG
jgi:L-2-hydroxyglutarate oxidase LhgO